jgi:hypothetical protein
MHLIVEAGGGIIETQIVSINTLKMQNYNILLVLQMRLNLIIVEDER